MRRAMVLALVAGCMPAQVQSALVETGDISARYEVVTAADGTTRGAASFLWITGEAEILLDDGDSVTVDGLVLDPEAPRSAVYARELDAAAEHTFVFGRVGEMIEHAVQTAPAFAITSEPFSGTYDLQGTLTWGPTISDGAKVAITARGTPAGCGTTVLESDLVDTGSYAFTGADVKPVVGEMAAPPPCTFSLEVQRTVRASGADSALGNASLVGIHVEATTLMLR